jgi:hypothetical protein
MIITSAKYTKAHDSEGSLTGDNLGIVIVLNGVTSHVPLDPANRHYAEIMRQVEAGELTIADAD